MAARPGPPAERGGGLPPAAWVLPLGLLLCFFYGLGGLPLFDLDEGAFSEATREMLARGDFITTYLNGEPRFDKPILIYWLQAVAVALIGIDEWAFRLPSALAASAWMVAVYRFGREFMDETTGLAAALVGMTSAVVVVIGRAATADALLNLWLCLALLTMYRYHERLALLAYLFMGLGFLTKGPVAVVIPGAVSLLFFASTGRWRPWLRALLYPPGWLVFLAVALPWYVLEYLDQGQAFIDGFFLRHNVGRFSDTMEGHGGALYYYALATPLVVMPWTALLLAVVPTLRRVVVDPLDRFLWIWFGLVFVLFSLSGTQLPHYILYGATPLFLLMARHRERLRSRWLAWLPPVLFLALVAALPWVLPAVVPRVRATYEAAMLARAAEAFDWTYHAAALLALAAAFAHAAWRRLAPWQGLAVLGLVQVVALHHSVGAALAELQQAPVQRAAAVARELDEPVVAYRIRMPSFSVYLGDVTPARDPRPGELVYTRVDRLDDLPPHDVVFRQGGIVLARVRPGDGRTDGG